MTAGILWASCRHSPVEDLYSHTMGCLHSKKKKFSISVAWHKISYVRSINKKVLQPSGHLGTYTKIGRLSYDEKLPKIYFDTFFQKTLERILDVNITCQNEVKGKKNQFYSLPLHNGPNVCGSNVTAQILQNRKL